jgi:hypothetical protein
MNRLTLNHFIVTVLLLIIGTIFIAGCVVSPVPENRTNISTGAIATLTTPSVPTQCPPESGDVTPYIIINPISTHNERDVFEINGTTNLGVDKKLKVTVDEDRPTAVGPYAVPDWNYTYTDSRGYVTINHGNSGINSWSYQVNLTGFHGQKLYGVNVYSEQNQTIINYSVFFVRREE